jgi:hypothetical protein
MKVNFKIFLFGLFLFLGLFMNAQPVNIYLSENNIMNRVEYNADLNSGTLQKNFFSTAWRSGDVELRATNANFENSNNLLPSSIIGFKLLTIAGQTPGSNNLKGSGFDYQSLSTGFNPFFRPAGLYAAVSFGSIIMSYRIQQDVFNMNKFVGGQYSINIDHNQPDNSWLGLGGNYDIVPLSWKFNINVPSFATWYQTQNVYAYTYNSIPDFSTAQDLVFDLSNFQFSHTINTNVEVKSQSNINFAPHGGGTASTIPINIAKVFGAGITTKTISTSAQTINTSPFVVPVGNRTTVPMKIRIKAADVKQNLFKAGTYSFNLDFNLKNTSGAITDTKSVAFSITTQPLNNISVLGSQDVNFSFASPSDFQTGKSVNMANHLLVTNNKAFEIYVKSASANFSLNGTPTTLPASIVQIENGTGQTGIITRSLGTTSQAIMSGAAPALNQNISLKYTIPAAQVALLLSQSPGATPFVLNVIYSFTNQ